MRLLTLFLFLSLWSPWGSARGAEHPLLARDSGSAFGDVLDLSAATADEDGALTITSATVGSLTASTATLTTATIGHLTATTATLSGYLTTEADPVFGASTAAGIDSTDVTNLGTLTDDSMADTLHRHSELSASDGSPNPALTATAAGSVDLETEGQAYLYDGVNAVKLEKRLVAHYGATLLGDTGGGTGDRATALGYKALDGSTSAYSVGVGYYAGEGATGDSSTYVGFQAGDGGATGNKSAGVGRLALYDNGGNYANAVGFQAGRGNSGTGLVAMGQYAGYYNSGANPVFLGYYAGRDNTGTGSVGIGYLALYQSGGAHNIALGYEAGKSNTGDGCVFIGRDAGKDNSTDDQFILKNSQASATALITGDFGTGALNLSNTAITVDSHGGNVGIGTASPGATLDVRGSAVFNEDGGNHDFRIEGDTSAYLLFVDASTDKVYLGGTSSVTSSDIDLSTNLTLRYHLDDNGDSTVADSAGGVTVYDGTYMDSTGAIRTDTDTSAEHIGTGAIGFDGVDEYINTGTDNSTADFFDGDWSISLFFSANDGMPEWAEYLWGVDHLNGNGEQDLAAAKIEPSGRITCEYRANDGTLVTATTDQQILPDGPTGWRHVVFVYDSSANADYGLSIWYNGARQPALFGAKGNNSGVTESNWESTISFYLGALNQEGEGAATDFYAGSMDEFRFYDGVLTSEQIMALYNNGAGTAANTAGYDVEVEGNMHVAGDLHAQSLVYLSDPMTKEITEREPVVEKRLSEATDLLLKYRAKSDTLVVNPSTAMVAEFSDKRYIRQRLGLDAERLAALGATGTLPEELVFRRPDGYLAIDGAAMDAWLFGVVRDQQARIEALEASLAALEARVRKLESPFTREDVR